MLPVLLYARALPYGVLDYDDTQYYLHNASLHGGGWRGLLELWTTPYYSEYFPVTQATMWLDLRLFGTSSWWGARLHGLAWFGLGAWAVRAFVARLTGSRRLGFAVALLYALHPVCGQSVLWLAERKNLVCFALSWFAAERYLAWRDEADGGKRPYRYAAACLLLAAALLAKVHAVAVPGILLVCEVLRGRGPLLKRCAPLGPLFAAAGAFALWNVAYIRSDLHRGTFGGSVPAAILGDGSILLRYLGLTVWPAELCLFYDVPEPLATAGWNAAAWVLALAAMLACAYLARERKTAALAWLSGLAAMAPALNLSPQFILMSDHYLQWALPGWLLGLVLACEGLAARAGGGPAARARQARLALLAAAGALSVLAFLQTPRFRSQVALFEDNALKQPRSALAAQRLAWALSSSGIPEFQEQVGEISFRALGLPGAERILMPDRAFAIRQAALWLAEQDQDAQAHELIRREAAYFGPTVFPIEAIIHAELDARAERPGEAVKKLESFYSAPLREAAGRLRALCRDGVKLPHEVPPQLELKLTGMDSTDFLWARAWLLRGLLVLAGAHAKLQQPEPAFDVAAVLVNLAPDYAPGRIMLAGVYGHLNLPSASLRMRQGLEQP
ncbi:MAG: hypothetical protein M5U26_16615 [Planctomycetota bacterium]|nr:hypothetical protein [Planctomycetota bacterium]